MKERLRFFGIKLLIIVIFDVLALAGGLLAGWLIAPMLNGFEQSVIELVSSIVSAAAMAAIFFGNVFTTARKFRHPDDETATLFALKETAPYALFLLPLLILGICGITPSAADGFLGAVGQYVYLPQRLLGAFGVPGVIDAGVHLFAYLGVCLLAFRFPKAKKQA